MFEENGKLREKVLVNKLNAITVFSQGIAHDFKNIMTIIQGNITLARMELEENEKPLELLTEAESVCERAKKLIYQLSCLSTDFSAEKNIINLSGVLMNATRYCLRNSSVVSRFSIDKRLFCTRANEGQIYQVVTNLVINAVEAMENEGELSITATNVFIDSGSDLPLNKGWYIRADIEDTGVGIPERDIEKIFEPYYSTKNGKGLGLAITRSIVKKHGGHISVVSNYGKGSVFHIYLPADGSREITEDFE